jgi:CRP-like cAMP-binding protein
MDIARVQSITAFQDLPGDALKKIAFLAKERTVPAGTDLMRQGDFSGDVICILDGSVTVTQDGEHVADLTAGDILGEGGALDKSLRGATVTANSPLLVFSLGNLEINRLRKVAPVVVERLEALDDERRR